MRKQRLVTMVAAGAAAVMTLSACGGGGGSSNNNNKGGGNPSATGPNAAIGKVFNPSDKKGGTLRMANAGDWDSLDPGDTYYAYSWNFIRLYGRSLMMFASAPGQDGAKLTPDLAESKGVPSEDLKTWTYKIRKGVKFDDGTPVTSKDVKYGVSRSLDKDTFPNGPTYFNEFLDLQGYTSPYKDSDPNGLGLKAIETPDDQTIVFKLKKPFADFDYFAGMPATMPVPKAKDDGTKYKEHVVSTGPYKFEKVELGKSFTLVRNTNWDQATDPNRKALPDKITMQLNVNADDLDNRLMSGDLDVDVVGSGVQPAAQAKILADPNLKNASDNPLSARLWYTNINGEVAPLDNIECRKAVEYAADRTGYQRAYGGNAGGEIASSLLPPIIPGAEKIDLYPSKDSAGDVDKAKEALTKCGQPNGFETNISYRAERPKEKATAESLQQSLGRVGIKLNIKPYPTGDYAKLYAGKPDFAKSNNLGLMVFGWAADWPNGFGFLKEITDSRNIKAAGNTNFSIKDPKVNDAIDKAMTEKDENARQKAWVDVDRKAMESAYALPGVVAKGLYYRPKNLTNVFITDGFSEYDYLALGVSG
ncbi:ABC transporter substrate-binding protein [Kibdelosporangium phytohabitans]|uniref:ABC transporter substrate-binding protein n=1 Tax=Kibdelosporangium phytohabitans TaxID=860235 RepID=A0A0N9HVD6_9PSEU|nr:ABC transporter substrate-binding protein [Kibdelosporangium phytohabitans]ALG05750.1 ABC transporter substrate-binding protein [Kibdelosporangium phytohabitans]MBE1466253.1 peptide/nickel transport system substrate-binding protein [Kibdelosporangium phytohabitans]